MSGSNCCNVSAVKNIKYKIMNVKGLLRHDIHMYHETAQVAAGGE
jgi:hypothetical protein